jgi:hypothetical protein
MPIAASGFQVAQQSHRKNCDSRKDAKHVLSDVEGAPRSEKINECLTLRAWRLGAINFLKVALFNLSKVSA